MSAETTHTTSLYRNPVPLNSELHGSWTIAPGSNGYSFAVATQTVLLTSAEFFDSCRTMPIIFALDKQQQVVPVALLGLEQDENLFVAADGSWRGGYVPAYLRRYPFITTDGAEGEVTVCLDDAFDGFNTEGGIALFDDGEPSAKTREIQAFLHDYLMQSNQTSQFCATLQQAGLFKQIDAQANLDDGRTFTLNGMLVVDEQRLAMLPDLDIIKLFRSGMLALINAHLLSLRTLGELMKLKKER